MYPFASSVDNGWLASALIMVANAVPELHDRAWELATSMDFGCYYDPGANLIRGGFWLEGAAQPGSDGFPRDFYCDETGTDVVYTGHHYGAFNTEPRIASYIGIALDQIPERHYFGGWRTFPPTCDWAWVETRPVGEWTTYVVDGQPTDVFEGAYAFDDQLVVPTWGGSMFEALMVPLVVPEEEWGPMSWAVTHPLYVESAIEYGLDEEFADYGYWGLQPVEQPGRRLPRIRRRRHRHGAERLYRRRRAAFVRRCGLPGRRGRLLRRRWWARTPKPPPDDYGQGVVTPHAAFLALDFDPEATLENLANLAADFPGLYGKGGFKDSVNVATGQVADRYLGLDQGMVIAAIANELTDDALQSYLAVTLQPTRCSH